MNARTVPRVAWSLWTLGIVAFVASLALTFAIKGSPGGGGEVTQLPAFFAIGTVGLVIARNRPENPLGWLYLGVWASVGVVFGALGEYAYWATVAHPGAIGGTFAVWLSNWTWIPIFAPLVTFPFLLFPDGRVPSARWRLLPRAIVVTLIAWSVSFSLEGHDYSDALGNPARNPYAPRGLVGFFDGARVAVSFVFLALAFLCVASLIMRFRRSRGDERAQIKWLIVAGAFLVTYIALPLNHGNGGIVDLLLGLFLALIPLATGVAILKYRLYEIDVVINKAVVFGVLGAFITIVYVGIVVGVGTAIGSRGNAVLSGVAAATVALAFQPVRRWAGRVANRLVYGKRATPYEVLADFSGRVGEAYDPDDVLPRMARVLADGTGASSSTVWLLVGGELRAAATWPHDAEPTDGGAVEVRHRGELLGKLAVAMPANDQLDAARERLVADLASQAGLVLRNVRLIEELKASRQRLVAAQDEERRRIERNIHDGAQQQLVALAVKARLARAAADAQPANAAAMLEGIEADLVTALEDLRDLARGVYPPLLADRGLTAALESQARKAALPVTLEAEGIGRFPADVEATIYFCALEALNNVAKYAHASAATVRVTNGAGELRFEVRDDGAGFDPSATGYGTGLQGMADRLAALGGELEVRSTPGDGTTVAGRLPAEVVS